MSTKYRNYLIQLPDDVRIVGSQRSERNRFEYETLYRSASKDFVGTERDFVKAGHGYAYVQVDRFTRRTVQID